MLAAALALLCAAAALGAGLAIRYFRGPDAKAPAAAILAAHATLGAASLATLLVALRHGLPPSGMGTAGFGPIGAALLGLTLLFGLRLALLSWGRRRPSEILIGVHAGVAIVALVLLLSLVALR